MSTKRPRKGVRMVRGTRRRSAAAPVADEPPLEPWMALGDTLATLTDAQLAAAVRDYLLLPQPLGAWCTPVLYGVVYALEGQPEDADTPGADLVATLLEYVLLPQIFGAQWNALLYEVVSRLRGESVPDADP